MYTFNYNIILSIKLKNKWFQQRLKIQSLLASNIGDSKTRRELTRERVEIFREVEAGYSTKPAWPENTTRP